MDLEYYLYFIIQLLSIGQSLLYLFNGRSMPYYLQSNIEIGNGEDSDDEDYEDYGNEEDMPIIY